MNIAIAATLAAGLALAIEEYFWLRRRGKLDGHARRELKLSYSCVIPNAIVSIALAGAWMGLYKLLYDLTPLRVATTPWTILIALVGADFCYYWEHRCAHGLPILWKLYHGAHHSSDRYTIATAYRVSFLNQFVAPFFYAPLVLAGIEPLLVFTLQLFILHYQAWVHTEMIDSLGWFDRFFNTPANHRVHHSRAPEHRHCNFGSILMVWDRIFGTYVQPRRDIEFGNGTTAPQSLSQLHFMLWRK